MNKAFTLIELLVVVLIIGILSAIALPQYQKAVEKARAAEALSLASNLQKAIDVWVLENGISNTENVWTNFLGNSATGILDIDLPSEFDCSFGEGTECLGKNFAYSAGCGVGSCWITAARYVNENNAYTINWMKSSPSSSWTGDECDYYPDVLAAGEVICKGLEAQGNGFFACEDC